MVCLILLAQTSHICAGRPSLTAQLQLQTFSEIELEAELHLTRSDGRVLDRPEVPVVHRRVRRSEHGMIKRVAGLDAELEIHLLAYSELLPQRQIGSEVRRAAQATQSSRSVTESVIVRTHEIGVDVRVVTCKVVVHPIRAMIAFRIT